MFIAAIHACSYMLNTINDSSIKHVAYCISHMTGHLVTPGTPIHTYISSSVCASYSNSISFIELLS